MSPKSSEEAQSSDDYVSTQKTAGHGCGREYALYTAVRWQIFKGGRTLKQKPKNAATFNYSGSGEHSQMHFPPPFFLLLSSDFFFFYSFRLDWESGSSKAYTAAHGWLLHCLFFITFFSLYTFSFQLGFASFFFFTSIC